MNISYEGIDAVVVTVPVGNCAIGQVCKIGTSGYADQCASGDKFCGVTIHKEPNIATVQVEGFVRVGYSGNKPSCGYVNLVADGNGKVMANSNGREYLVVQVDTKSSTVIIKL